MENSKISLGRRVLNRATYSLMQLVDPVLPVEVRLQGPAYLVNYIRDLYDEWNGQAEPEIPQDG